MVTATVRVSADDLSGSYESVGDVLYLSAPGDDKRASAQETPEGHAVRLDGTGRVTHLTAINARWLLDRDAMVADGRQLRLRPHDIADLMA